MQYCGIRDKLENSLHTAKDRGLSGKLLCNKVFAGYSNGHMTRWILNFVREPVPPFSGPENETLACPIYFRTARTSEYLGAAEEIARSPGPSVESPNTISRPTRW